MIFQAHSFGGNSFQTASPDSNRIEIVHLKPGMKLEAEFTYSPGEDEILFTGEHDEIGRTVKASPGIL